jgi:Flp pilus assembly protein TadB
MTAQGRTMPERMARIETLLGDPDLGLIAHVTRVDRKVDDGLAEVNTKLDTILRDRETVAAALAAVTAQRRPILAALRYSATAFVGALTFWLVNFSLPKHS